jgi:hypothetical protein
MEGEQMTGSSEQASGKRAYRLGIGVAFVTSFLTVWTTIVHDDGNGIGFFLLIMAAVVRGFAAWFQPAGMARTMVGVAIMQALLSSRYRDRALDRQHARSAGEGLAVRRFPRRALAHIGHLFAVPPRTRTTEWLPRIRYEWGAADVAERSAA